MSAKATKTATHSRNGNLNAQGELPEPKDAKLEQEVSISPPNFGELALKIRGTSPLVINRFGAKARGIMIETQMAGSVAKKGKRREPKDFEGLCEDAKHIAKFERDENGEFVPCKEPWCAIHAGAFRRAMVDACRLTGFAMTRAKLGVFIVSDGLDEDGTPLVRITKGTPHMTILPVRNSSGVADMRPRPQWAPGWEATVRIKYDADMFSATDVVNLLARVGMQCGIGEGRANSKESTGCSWGEFEVVPGATI